VAYVDKATPATSYCGDDNEFDQSDESDSDVEWSNKHHNEYVVVSEGQVIVDYDLIREVDMIFECPSIVVEEYIRREPRAKRECISYYNATNDIMWMSYRLDQIDSRRDMNVDKRCYTDHGTIVGYM
jgi:hypothetical protein